MVRRVVFRVHLTIGLVIGVVVRVMPATGILLAFAPQIVERARGPS